jgi:putative transposase
MYTKPMQKQHIILSASDEQYLLSLTSKGHASAKEFKRALALLNLNDGYSITEVARIVCTTRQSVTTWRDSYLESALLCLKDKPRSGRPIEIDGLQRAKLTALACSPAPEGHAKWTLRLLADKAVELEFCEHLSHTTVKEILKKTN